MQQTKSVKIIKDRDEKPKGFGYVEFNDLDGLKDALAKSNSVSGPVPFVGFRIYDIGLVARWTLRQGQRC